MPSLPTACRWSLSHPLGPGHPAGSGLLMPAPPVLSTRPSELGARAPRRFLLPPQPPGSTELSRGFRVFSKNSQTSLDSPLFLLPPHTIVYSSFQGRNLRVCLRLPPPITILPTRRFSAQLTDQQSAKPKPKASLWFLEFLGLSLGCGSAQGTPMGAELLACQSLPSFLLFLKAWLAVRLAVMFGMSCFYQIEMHHPSSHTQLFLT